MNKEEIMREVDREMRTMSEIVKAHGGQITEEKLIEIARDPRHPLHGSFEWDDAEAAYCHRQGTAFSLIREEAHSRRSL